MPESRDPAFNLDHLPAALTVDEAATVLRIGRATAYEGVRMYLASGGAEGIPAIKVGPRTIRVPRAALLRRLSDDPANAGREPHADLRGCGERSGQRDAGEVRQ